MLDELVLPAPAQDDQLPPPRQAARNQLRLDRADRCVLLTLPDQ